MTPQFIHLRRPLRALCALALTLAATAALASSASAYVTPAEATHAAQRGANWFESNQQVSGDLGSDWAMTALAATEINAADVRTSLADPSAQDFYLGEWQASGPGGAGTDAERGILAGVAGGIQPSRLSTDADTTKSNLVARVAELFDGTQIGEPGLLNDDIFGVLALRQVDAPTPLLRRLAEYLRTKQLPDGGWSWNAAPGATADIDMTGSAIAAFCAAGIGTDDPDLQWALALLHSVQDPASGGFLAPPPFGVGVNTDTTSWVVSGLIQCGIDPQGPEWTTAQGKTPLDYLLSMQRPDGHFDWTSEYAGGAFEAYSSARSLAGVAFSTEAPARLNGSSPAIRPAAAVANGTPVPITLVIDHGPGAGDVRMCRVDIADGANLGEMLGAAEVASTPAGCVSQFATQTGPDGTGIASLDGVAANGDYGWQVRVDGGGAQVESDEPIGFGDLVFLKFEAKVAAPGPAPKVTVPPLSPAPQRASGPRARVLLQGEARWSKGSIVITARCPRGLGPSGCRGLLSAQFRKHREGRLFAAGSTAYQLDSGSQGQLAIVASEGLRDRLAERRRVKLRLTAVTRAEDGSAQLTHAKRVLAR